MRLKSSKHRSRGLGSRRRRTARRLALSLVKQRSQGGKGARIRRELRRRGDRLLRKLHERASYRLAQSALEEKKKVEKKPASGKRVEKKPPVQQEERKFPPRADSAGICFDCDKKVGGYRPCTCTFSKRDMEKAKRKEELDAISAAEQSRDAQIERCTSGPHSNYYYLPSPKGGRYRVKECIPCGVWWYDR